MHFTKLIFLFTIVSANKHTYKYRKRLSKTEKGVFLHTLDCMGVIILAFESEKSKEKEKVKVKLSIKEINCICTFSTIDREVYISFYSFLHKKKSGDNREYKTLLNRVNNINSIFTCKLRYILVFLILSRLFQYSR
jgi:hypothetical protein